MEEKGPKAQATNLALLNKEMSAPWERIAP